MAPAKISISNLPITPLPASLRNDITSALFSHTTSIPALQKTLLSECEKAGWLDAVRERSLQLLREDPGRGYEDVMGILLGEARGKGGMTKAKQQEDGKLIDVEFPEEVAKKGTKIVADALEHVVQFDGPR